MSSIKRLIMAYFNNFRWNGAGKRLGSGKFMMMILIPLYCLADIIPDFDRVENLDMAFIGMHGLLILKLIYLLFSGITHPVSNDKMLYLCPMERRERRAMYIEAYYGKIIVNTIISAIINFCIMLIVRNMGIWLFLAYTVTDFAMSTVVAKPEDMYRQGHNSFAGAWDTGSLINLLISYAGILLWIIRPLYSDTLQKNRTGLLTFGFCAAVFVPLALVNFKARKAELIRYEVYKEVWDKK